MNEVVVYTKASCPFCMQLKQFLAGRNIPYREIDVTMRPDILQQVAALTGYMNVPQTFVNGRVVIGFKPEEILMAMHARNHIWGE